MMPRISRRLLLIGLPVVALLCGLGVVFALRSAQTERDQIRTRIRSLATSAAATTDRYLIGRIETLRVIATLREFQRGDVAGMSSVLGRIGAQRRGFSQGVGWVDRTGRVRAPKATPSIDVSDRSYVQQVLTTGRPYVSEAITGRVRSNAVIVFAVPTLGADGHVNGVLAGGTRLVDLDLLTPSLEFAGTEVRLVDRAGNLLVGQGLSAGPTPVSSRSPYPEMRASRAGLVEGVVGLNGLPDRIIGYATTGTGDWLVALSEPRARAFASAVGNRRTELIALFAAGAIVTAGLLMASRWIGVNQAAEERRRRMRNRLREAAAALLAAVDAQSIGRVVATAAREELDASWAAVLTRDSEETAMIAAAGDPPDEVHTIALPGGDRSSVAVAEHRRGLGRSERPESIAPATLVRIDVGGKGIVLLLGFDSRRELDAIDQRSLSGLADDGALAFERAQLIVRELAARERADLLAQVGAELDMTDGSDERVRRLVRLLVPDLADVAVVGRPVVETDMIELTSIAHHDPDAQERLRRRWEGQSAPRLVPSDVHRFLVSGTPQLVEDAPDGVTLADLVGADIEGPWPAPLRSVIRVPLVAGNRIVAGLMLGRGESRSRFDRDDLALAADIAGRASVSIERARLYELEHGIAFQLQQSMLGAHATSFDEQVRVTSRYLPAERELQVGGDWHDAIALPGGLVGLVVGDVVGHGLSAAAAMGQLRSALRALAAWESNPAEVVRRLEAFALDTDGARLATVAYAILDAATGVLRYSVAGHPPPLLLGADGSVTYLWNGRSGPLGVSIAAERTEARTTVEAGTTIVLYSDGLFERRGELLDVSLGRLRSAVIAFRDGSPDELADGVLGAMLGGARKRDDVALVVARLDHVGVRLFRRIPAVAAELAQLRRDAREWLTDQGVTSAAAEDAVLALGEAAANAVEHAYRDGQNGQVEVELTHDDEAGICIVVRDSGRWRSPAAPGRRGRGTWIMQRLAHDVSTTTDAGGTTVVIRMSASASRPVAS